MTTEIKIHRGNQIGGCITEISTETTRILIDFGEELPGSKKEKPFDFPWQKRPVDAVLFTHYHGDHIGRFMEVPEDIPMYMGQLSKDVLVNIHSALRDACLKLAQWKGRREDKEELQRQEQLLAILADPKRVHIFQPARGRMMEPVQVGDIRITPCQVDHSASDACMFFIETPDKTILHTGDFRGHGRMGQGGEAVLEDVGHFAKKKIDTLIIEGTMMSRQDEAPYSEGELYRAAERLFEEHRHVFLIISSTNLDSLSTFYQAAKAKHISMYCYNTYTASQLNTLNQYAKAHLSLAGPEEVEVVDWSPNGRSQRARMREQGFLTIIKATPNCQKLVWELKDCKPVIVYSMWLGYVTRGLDEKLCSFLQSCQKEGVPVIPPLDGAPSPYPPMHTSGHASPRLIAQVIREAAPGEILPIHTEDAGGFLQLDIPDELKMRINLGGYRKEEDRRALSAHAVKKFLPGQPYHIFVQLVKKYPELAFCFRGNSDDAAIVYYKNHAAFYITKSGNIRFNFNHARFMPDWRERKKQMEDIGYSFQNKDTPRLSGTSYSIGDVSMPKKQAEQLTFHKLEELYTCTIRPMLESFFCAKEKGEYDRFRAEYSPDHEQRVSDLDLAEKPVQQQLFLACKKLENGYFFYDLEFAQPYGKMLGCKNQPDLLAVRFDRAGKPKRLVFVEVKSKPEALGGASGLAAHIRGMEHYPDWLLPVRGRDACHILEQYVQLGLISQPARNFQEEEFAGLPKEILLIFTGEETLKELKRFDAGLLGGYILATAEFPHLSAMGAMEIYRKEC